MKTTIKLFLMLSLFVFVPFSCDAQCTGGANACSQPVPHVVKFSGVLKNTVGIAHPNTVAIRFVIYSDEMHGTPLWQEVQNVQVDSQGRFEVMLGAASIEGVPDLFSTGEPRWVGVQPVSSGQEEQPRVQLVSVPYALQAGNAETLGGLPASAFVKATPTVALRSVVPQTTSPSIIAADSTEADPEIVFRTNPRSPTLSSNVNVVTTPNSIPKFYSNPPLVDSQITDQNGVVSMQNLSNILFADRFTGGVPDAVTACPASGCIIYAVSPNVNLNLGTIDPGFKAITIYLGPYTYTVKQITLRKALKIIGMGASGGSGSATCSATAPCNGTTLQSINGNNPVFVLPQANNAPATNVLLSGFRLLGSVGNTSEDGFFLDTSSLVDSGLWYSTFDDIYMEGFAGIAVHLRGPSNGFLSDVQWILFNNIVVYRPKGGANALRLEGSIFELRFTDCQFDGSGIGDGTNIYIGGLPGGGNAFPTSIMFEGLVSQSAATAVQIDGANNITFHNSHHEALWGGYQITNNTNIGTRGLTISDSSFNGNVGSNGGAGYELEITTSLAQGVIFAHNQLFGNPDFIVKGMNFAQVAYEDNLYVSLASNVPPTSGITMQVNPAASINIGGVHSVGLNASTTLITTIQSSLGPGEMVTFFTWYGPVTFGSGGNIDLMGQNTLTVNGSMTFVRNDLLGSLQWIPVSQWSPK